MMHLKNLNMVRSHACVWVKLSALILDSVLLPLSKTFFLLEALIKK